jgi:hypothetical protein
MESPKRDVTRDRRVTEFDEEGLDDLAMAFADLTYDGEGCAAIGFEVRFSRTDYFSHLTRLHDGGRR